MMQKRKPAPDMQTTLEGIVKRAQQDPAARFRDLYRLLNVDNLRLCYLELRRNAAVGVDNVTWEAYGAQIEENLHDLVQRLKGKRYQAKLVRRKHIPKENGKTRPLGIPALEDKIVQKGVSKILQGIYEVDFLNTSWGYRPQRGSQLASKVLAGRLAIGTYHYVVEADIRGFFDHIDHDQLLEMLGHRINDGALLNLIRKWLKAGILEEDGQVIDPISGSPQGGIVSPVLANIYLHYGLDLWFEQTVRAHVKGQAMIMRYADDFVCAFEHREAADAFMKVLPKRLGRIGLELSPEKTNLIRFSRQSLPEPRKKEAGPQDQGAPPKAPEPNGHFSFLGFQYDWERTRTGKSKVQRRTDPEKLKRSTANFSDWIQKNRHRPLPWVMRILRSKLIGYLNYYGVTGNLTQICKYWRLVHRLLHKWLNRRSHKTSFTWAQYRRLLERYRLPTPHITDHPSPRPA